GGCGARLRAKVANVEWDMPGRPAVAVDSPDRTATPAGAERGARAGYPLSGPLHFRPDDIHHNACISSEVPMQVARWGNSLAVRLPAVVVDALELKEGDEIEIRLDDSRQLAVSRKPGRAEFLRRLQAFR